MNGRRFFLVYFIDCTEHRFLNSWWTVITFGIGNWHIRLIHLRRSIKWNISWIIWCKISRTRLIRLSRIETIWSSFIFVFIVTRLIKFSFFFSKMEKLTFSSSWSESSPSGKIPTEYHLAMTSDVRLLSGVVHSASSTLIFSSSFLMQKS